MVLLRPLLTSLLSQYVPSVIRISDASSNSTFHSYAKRALPTDHIIFACLIPVLVLLSGIFAGLTLGYMSLDETQLNVLSTSGTPFVTSYLFISLVIPHRPQSTETLCREDQAHQEKRPFTLGHLTSREHDRQRDSSCCLRPHSRGWSPECCRQYRPHCYVSFITPVIVPPIMSSPYSPNLFIHSFSEIIPQSLCTRHGLYFGAQMAGFTRVLICILVRPLRNRADYPT